MGWYNGLYLISSVFHISSLLDAMSCSDIVYTTDFWHDTKQLYQYNMHKMCMCNVFLICIVVSYLKFYITNISEYFPCNTGIQQGTGGSDITWGKLKQNCT